MAVMSYFPERKSAADTSGGSGCAGAAQASSAADIVAANVFNTEVTS